MDKSTHKVEIVPVKLEPHPNADSLSIVYIFGYSVCVRTVDWIDKSIGAYIPPDSIVSTKRPEFSFLKRDGKDSVRIKVKRLRGLISMGLLIPAPTDSKLGDNVAEQLDVTHYEPPLQISTGGEDEKGPDGFYPKYDVDSLRRYLHLFNNDEKVFLTEKIHGSSSKYVYLNGRMYCGSRTQWKKEDDKSIWWKAFYNQPQIEDFCKNNPSLILYGEVFGKVQSLRYGMENEVKFAAFDILQGDKWWEPKKFLETVTKYKVFSVPLIAIDFPYDFGRICDLAEDDSRIEGANHCSEGIVVKPMEERYDVEIGRVCLKLVSNRYLCK